MSPTAPSSDAPPRRKRIAIFIVTYNAATTLASVLDRIAPEVWEKVEEVFVFDDSSQDDTYLIGRGYKTLHGRAKLNVFRNEKNQGYGGNQIRGYRYALEKGYDIVVLLHGDGQYAPEVLPELLAPLERGDADAVFGSRMMTPTGAIAGGMPLYKYLGNRVLTLFENSLLGMNLSEFHSGYRLYSCEALRQIPFERNTHDFHFDTQIIVQFKAAGLRIVEVPIPTYYGDEICYVNGMKYAKDVVRSVVAFRLHELGLMHRPEYELRPRYTLKRSELSSHSQLLKMVGPPPSRILDVGCGQGELSHQLCKRGHHVTGLDLYEPDFPIDDFRRVDIGGGLGLSPEERFDTILFADVLEHLVDPAARLREALEHLSPQGRILVSLPNAVHWTMRAQIAFGRFEYTNRGLLDRGHLRFFTLRTAARLFSEVGLEIREHRTTPIPWEHIVPSSASLVRHGLEKTELTLSHLAPNAFAYQHLFELGRAAK